MTKSAVFLCLIFSCSQVFAEGSLRETLGKVALVLNQSNQSLCPTGKLDLSQGFRIYSENGFPGAEFDISFSLVNWEVQGEENPLIQDYPAQIYSAQDGEQRKNCVTRSIASFVNESSEELTVLSQGLSACSDKSTAPVTSTLSISKRGQILEVEVMKFNGPSQVICKYSATLP